MSAFEVVCSAEDREAWLQARRVLCTASTLPIILGLRPGKLALHLWMRGLVDELVTPNEAMDMGTELEPTVGAMFARRTGREIRKAGVLIRSTRYPWLGATLDYEQTHPDRAEPGALECKTTGDRGAWVDDGEPKLEWQVQLQQQLLVRGLPWGSLAALIGAPHMRFRHADFDVHADFHELIVDRTRSFYEGVQRGELPEPDGSAIEARALQRTTEVLAGTRVVLPREAIEWDRRLGELHEQRAALEDEHRLLESKIMAAIGTATTGDLSDPSGVAWEFRTQTRRAYTVAESTFRVLRRRPGYERRAP